MLRARSRRRRGVALVWMAVIGLVLMGLLGLAIDTGYVYLVSRQLQDAADAAALAGAIKVGTDTVANVQAAAVAPPNKAAGATVQYTYTSGTNPGTANPTNSDIVIGTFNTGDTDITPTTTNPNAVKVFARRTTGSASGPVSLFFGPIFGINTAESKRSAIAHQGQALTGAGLVVLGTTGTDINLNNSTLTVNNGGPIWVNSNGTGSNVAVKESSNSTISASDIYVNGGSSSLQLSGTFTGATHVNAGVLADPLGSLAAPSPPTTYVQTNTWTTAATGGTHIQPGYYQKGIKVSNGTLILDNGGGSVPPIYYIGNGSDNTGFNINNTTVDATSGVMIYVASGAFTYPSGSFQIKAPSSGTYANVAIFQSRTNAAGAAINGSSTVTVDGALYFPDNAVALTGSGGIQSTGNQLIANSISMTGGTFNLFYSSTTAFKDVLSSTKTPYLVK